MSDLLKAQTNFAYMVGQFLIWIFENHEVTVTFGEAYRTPEQAALNAAKGTGIAQSLHTSRLAIDLNLYIDGVYQTNTAAYEPLGVYWESIGGSWGGRFSKPDGNHFSLAYGGHR